MATLWKSRKFRIMVYDTVVSLVTVIGGWFLAPDMMDKIITVIGILQAPVLFVIGGIAYEDAAQKANVFTAEDK